MPFRVPMSYQFLTLEGRDPTEPELAAYLDWLRCEVVAAEAAFDAMTNDNRRPQTAAVRAPLASHKVTLRKLLAENSSMSRASILKRTNIPPGSLSALLNDPEFRQNENGRWSLNKAEVPS